VAIGLATAEALAQLHEIGLVFRDFKPANTLKTPDGHYRLIDFGIAHNYREHTSEPLSTGTPPFYSREQYEGQTPNPADDIFAWGAVLHHLAGGDQAFETMPKDKDFLRPFPRKPLAQIKPSFPAALCSVIDRAVAWERAQRFATMREARDALANAAREIATRQGGCSSRTRAVADRTKTVPASSALGNDEALGLACEVGDALCKAAESHAGGLRWKRRFEWVERTEYSPDLYAGAAGIALFLAELARATGEERYADAARAAARWVAGPAWGRGRAQHGFHSGEAGIAFFFLRLSELLDAPGYIAAADMRLRRLRGAAALTSDLMYGTGGTILGLLAMYAATRDSGFLAEAREHGDRLVNTASTAKQGQGCYWDVASAAPGGPVLPHLGLLHGSAGIGLALAYLGCATGEDRYIAAARGAADLLLSSAACASQRPGGEPCETTAAHLTWPGHLEDTAKGLQAHCHGAGGVGQFFLWLDALVSDRRYREAAEGAACAIAAQRAGETRAGICHGISGTGHLMLDCHQDLGGAQWLALARACAGHLQRFRIPDQPGVYAMHDKGAVSPDLMLGYAGAGSFLLRLSGAASSSDLLFGPLNKIIRELSRLRPDVVSAPQAQDGPRLVPSTQGVALASSPSL
ncbi:MAG: lanthionine synthetase LanC family protein, partial [Pseudorhodoplanes sp.]